MKDFVLPATFLTLSCFGHIFPAQAQLRTAKALVLYPGTDSHHYTWDSGIYLPSSYSHNGSPVYFNEHRDRFLARNRFSWCLGDLKDIDSALLNLPEGSSFGVFQCNDFNDDPKKGWNSFTVAEEQDLILIFHAKSENSEYSGTYFLSTYVVNGRGVYINEIEGSNLFVCFDGELWVIASISTLSNALEGNVRGFATSTSLRDGWEAYDVEVVEELCELSQAHDGEHAMKCFNKCVAIGCKAHEECERVVEGMECRDIDECASPSTHTCHEANQGCVNVVGGFECACLDGFGWNGVACNEGCDSIVPATFVQASSSTFVNPRGAIDGVKGFPGLTEENLSFQYADTCNAVHFMVLDLGSVRSLTEITVFSFHLYYERRYCSQSVDLSVTGAFDGEETRVFSCDSFQDCGVATEDGRRVRFEATPARFVRVGSSRNDIENSVGVLEVEARAQPCSPLATCAGSEPGSISQWLNSELATESYQCTCNTGYDGDGVACDTCARGYGMAEDGSTCVDIDECAQGSHSCDANAVCSNTVGSYECACNKGYEGDGVQCETCAPGYSKLTDGVTCDYDECADQSHSCTPDAMCSNMLGGYMCSCVEGGFEWNGTVCIDINECILAVDVNFVSASGTIDNAGGAIDGVKDPRRWHDSGSRADVSTCEDVEYVLLDLGSVRSLTETTFWNFFADERRYCSQSVDLSVTGAFDGEETRVFSCDSFQDCGVATEDGRRVRFEATPARFVRVGSSRNDRNTGVHILEVEARAQPCSAYASCSNTAGAYECACDEGSEGDGTICHPFPAVVQISFLPEYEWTEDPRVMHTFEPVGRWDGIYSRQFDYATGALERHGRPIYAKVVGSHAGFVTSLLVHNGSSWIIEFPDQSRGRIYPTPESVPENIAVAESLGAETYNWPIIKRTLGYDAFVLEAVGGSSDYADCDGLYQHFGHGFQVNGKEIWVHSRKDRFIAWGGYSWILAGFKVLNSALDNGGLFEGYHFSYSDDPRFGWANYTAQGVIGWTYGFNTYRNQHEEPLECEHGCAPWTVRQVGVRAGATLSQLIFHYADGSSRAEGLEEGVQQLSFVLEQDEVLVRVQRREVDGACGVAMRFVTNHGRSSQWYGDSSGPQLEDVVASEQDPIVGVQVGELEGGCPGSPAVGGVIRQTEASNGVCLPCQSSSPPLP